LTQHEADAEDLVAEAITRAWRARASLTETADFRAWMLRILTNTFISVRRKTLARPREELLMDESSEGKGRFLDFRASAPAVFCCGSRILNRSSSTNCCARIWIARSARCPEHYRVVVVLADVEGLKYGEIAAAIGVPIGTVRSRLARSRSTLQRTLWDVARDHGFQIARAAATHG
jgi:RNA polymerase sigma-70 factor (ECF subfamily)